MRKCGLAGRRHLSGNGRKAEDMGKRENKRYGWLAVFSLIVILCLWENRGQAYAQEEDSDGRLIRYSVGMRDKNSLPEAPEEYLGEDGSRYRLFQTEVEEVSVHGRNREVSGEILYTEVTKSQDIPEQAPMEVEDAESGQTLLAALNFQHCDYENERWQDGFSFSVVFHHYGAGRYRLEGEMIEQDSGELRLADCQGVLLQSAGLSEEEVQIESARWDGEAYQDADEVWCRNAQVEGKRKVWDCRAVYGGVVELPEYIRYRMKMEYIKEETEVPEENIQETETLALEDIKEGTVDTIPLPFWRRWVRYGLAVSVSLLLIVFLWFCFEKIRAFAKKREEG